MKKAVAVVMIFAILLTAFTACKKKNIITDYEGHEHSLVMKDGEYVQDELGNLVENITDADGNKATNIISFPNVIQNSKSEIENAYFKLKIPNGWKFDDSIRAFRIQHDGECTKNGAVCEISSESDSSGDTFKLYSFQIGRDEDIEKLDSSVVTDIKEFEDTIFGIECSAFSSRYNDNCTHYCYVFAYANAAIAVNMLISDSCKDDDFDPKAFIEEIFTLKKLG